MKALYLALAAAGAILPYSRFIPWVQEHGVDVPLLVHELWSTRIGAFFGLDVVISAIVLIVFVVRDGARQGVRHLWLPILATCVIGVSCGFPLYLYLRETRER
jgi:hypothetical protein